MNRKGQSLLELVMGVGLITVILGAMAVVAINTLRNTQFSKNQTQATKFAQEDLEKVRTIKNSNFGVCLQSEIAAGSPCSTWEDIWIVNFGTVAGGCLTSPSVGCTYILQNNCTINTGEVKPFCLVYNANKGVSGRFTYQILIEDEGVQQKRVTSRVYWSDSTSTAPTNTTGVTNPEHSSDLVTILTRY